MSCNPIIDSEGKKIGFICGGYPIYEYEYNNRKYIFEIHHYCGPTWLKKDLQPRKNHCPRMGHEFWSMLEEFEALSKEEQKRYKI